MVMRNSFISVLHRRPLLKVLHLPLIVRSSVSTVRAWERLVLILPIRRIKRPATSSGLKQRNPVHIRRRSPSTAIRYPIVIRHRVRTNATFYSDVKLLSIGRSVCRLASRNVYGGSRSLQWVVWFTSSAYSCLRCGKDVVCLDQKAMRTFFSRNTGWNSCLILYVLWISTDE